MPLKTLYDKLWEDHLIHESDDGSCLMYIDRHIAHEVTTPQAFEGLETVSYTHLTLPTKRIV